MRIAVIGPGAIGCLFAALLSRAGNELWLVDRHPQRAGMLNRRGVFVSRSTTVEGAEGVPKKFHAAVRATTDPRQIGPVDLVIVAVKSFHTSEAAQAAAALVVGETAALTLQNGLGNLEILQQMLGAERVIGGVTSQGATLVAPGQVHHAGNGPTVIGEVSGVLSERLLVIQETFSQAGIQTETTTHLASTLWGKLVVNVGLNAVGALAHVRNGGIMESTHLRQAMAAAVQEAVAVARAKDIPLPHPDMASRAEETCQRTENNINSMLQDLLRNRRTEVDAINGAVVIQGAAAGVPTPVNSTLLSLIQGLEDTYPIRMARSECGAGSEFTPSQVEGCPALEG
jgi:2-dehydropantoate 2-reductase